MKELHQYAEEISSIMEKCYQNDDKLMCSSMKLPDLTVWQESDFTEKQFFFPIPGYEDMNYAGFMKYENTGMVQGTFLSAMCFRYQAAGEGTALEKARRTFQSIRRVYEASQKIAPGFYCKPWNGTTTDETSSDQYIYTMSGLDEYYALADADEKAMIREMMVSMARFWLDHNYDWKYYGRDLHWREIRFISFMAFALKYGAAKKFEVELERLIALQNSTPDTSPFRSTHKENEYINKAGLISLRSCPETALSTFLSYEEAMKNGRTGEQIKQICVESLLHGKDCLVGDGTVYGLRVKENADAPFREIRKEESHFSHAPDLSPIFNLYAPLRKGGMQSTMFARFVLAFEAVAPEYADRELVKEILRQTQIKHLTWFEDPFGVFPEEIKWMTQVFSGDAAAHFLWCYWKLRLLGEK